MEAAFDQLERALPITLSQGGRDVVSARALHAYLEVATPYTIWFARRVGEYSFTERQDFLTILLESTGGRPETDAALTLDTAKEIAMVERTDRGREVRRYFIWAEKRLREVAAAPRPTLPTSYKEALTALLAEVEEKERLEQQIALAAPKVAFFDAVAVATNAVSFSQAAKWLKIPGAEGRNRLIDRLRADGVLMKSREPYQQYIDAGYFEVAPQTFAAGEKGQRITNTTRVTGRGMEWLARRYKVEVKKLP